MADKRPRFQDCACQYDEAGDDILEPCLVHSLWRAVAVEAENNACAEIARRRSEWDSNTHTNKMLMRFTCLKIVAAIEERSKDND